MVDVVVDASALGALLFGEPEAEAVAAQLAGKVLAAPTLLDFELANICVIKLRRFPRRRDALLSGYALRSTLMIDRIEVDHAAVIDLAEKAQLTAYDASYLWLARELDAALVTLDKALARALASI